MRGVIDKLASRLTGFRMVGILLRPRRHGPRQRRAAEQHDELAALHVWMAPAWQEIFERAAQRSLAVMCPAC